MWCWYRATAAGPAPCRPSSPPPERAWPCFRLATATGSATRVRVWCAAGSDAARRCWRHLAPARSGYGWTTTGWPCASAGRGDADCGTARCRCRVSRRSSREEPLRLCPGGSPAACTAMPAAAGPPVPPAQPRTAAQPRPALPRQRQRQFRAGWRRAAVCRHPYALVHDGHGPEVVQVWELVKAGGWPMLPLILLGLVALAIVIERLWTLRRVEVMP